MLLFLSSAMTVENGAAEVAVPADRADTLAQLGIKACVPRPSVEPPPLIEVERSAPELCPCRPGRAALSRRLRAAADRTLGAQGPTR